MVTNFKQWASGCEERLTKIAHEIETLGNVTRDIRTNAVKFDQQTAARGRVADSNSSEQSLPLLLASIESLSSLEAWRNFETATSARIAGATESPSKALRRAESNLRSVLTASEEISAEAPTGDAPKPPRRRPTLLQAGARHFAALAGIFQLRDCFDQRVEHINAASRATSQGPQDDQSVMMQIVNAQVAGIASMTTDFTNAVIESASVLQSLHETTVSQSLERDSLSPEDAKSLAVRVVAPIKDLISISRSMYLELDSVAITGEVEQTEAAREARDILSNEQKDEINSALKEIEDRIDQWVARHPRLNMEVSSTSASDVLECYDSLQASILNLGDLAHELDAFTSDLTISEAPTNGPGPQASELIDRIVASFTMDVEREDHRSALHRLGLAST